MQEGPVTLDQELVSWLADCAGGRVTHVDRRPGGGRREAWYIDVTTPDGDVRQLFLRYDRLSPEDRGDPFTLHREAQFYRALEGSAVPTPAIVGVHPLEQAILAERVSGDARFSAISDEAEQLSVASDFMRILAVMHEIDPHRLELADQDADSDLRSLVRQEIDTWETVYRDAGDVSDALIDLGLTWVRDNVPDVDGPVVIVQGDTGPGNFLFQDGKVTAVLDLELGHLGDPHDDLAWVTTRAVQEPFTNIRDRFQDYAQVSGRKVDLDRVRYYRVLAELRIVILGHRTRLHPDPLSEVGNSLAYGLLHRRLLIEALADAAGIPIPETEAVTADPTDRGWVFDAALEQIRQIIVPRSEDPFVIARSKGLARMLKYLRDADRYADAVAETDLAELKSILGDRQVNVAAATSSVIDAYVAGEVELSSVVRLLAGQIARQTGLLRSAMGALADRHFDNLGTRTQES